MWLGWVAMHCLLQSQYVVATNTGAVLKQAELSIVSSILAAPTAVIQPLYRHAAVSFGFLPLSDNDCAPNAGESQKGKLLLPLRLRIPEGMLCHDMDSRASAEVLSFGHVSV